jgi:hypothetical protein
MQAAADPAASLTFNASSVARFLVVALILLVVANTDAMLVSYAMGRSAPDVRLAQFFYLDGERNLPTAFNTFLLLLAATLLTLITYFERRRSHPVMYWAVLALGFALMAVDEAWSFHERLTVPMRQALGNHDLGIYYAAWVVPAFGLLLLLGLFFLRFLIRLPRSTRLSFIVSGMVYIGGVVGLELIEGRYVETHGDRNITAGTISTIQETVEMVGVILFIRALLIYLAGNVGELRIRFEAPLGAAAGGATTGAAAGEAAEALPVSGDRAGSL